MSIRPSTGETVILRPDAKTAGRSGLGTCRGPDLLRILMRLTGGGRVTGLGGVAQNRSLKSARSAWGDKTQLHRIDECRWHRCSSESELWEAGSDHTPFGLRGHPSDLPLLDLLQSVSGAVPRRHPGSGGTEEHGVKHHMSNGSAAPMASIRTLVSERGSDGPKALRVDGNREGEGCTRSQKNANTWSKDHIRDHREDDRTCK